MLTFLSPLSRQIRPPIYSMKQSKLRRRRVIRFAILYYVMMVVFLALIIGPSLAGEQIPVDGITDMLSGLGDLRLVQPNGLDNDNTNSTSLTGTGAEDYTGVYKFSTGSTDGGGRATDRIKLF